MPKLIQTTKQTRTALSYNLTLTPIFHRDGSQGPITLEIDLGHAGNGNRYVASFTQAEALELIRRLTQTEVQAEFFPEKATLVNTNDSKH